MFHETVGTVGNLKHSPSGIVDNSDSKNNLGKVAHRSGFVGEKDTRTSRFVKNFTRLNCWKARDKEGREKLDKSKKAVRLLQPIRSSYEDKSSGVRSTDTNCKQNCGAKVAQVTRRSQGARTRCTYLFHRYRCPKLPRSRRSMAWIKGHR